jgi:hypothetical protein
MSDDYVQSWRQLDSARLPNAKAAFLQGQLNAASAYTSSSSSPSSHSTSKSRGLFSPLTSPKLARRTPGFGRSNKKKAKGEHNSKKKKRQFGGMGSSKSTSHLPTHMASSKYVHDTAYEADLANLAVEQLQAQTRYERKKIRSNERRQAGERAARKRSMVHSNTVSHFERIVGSTRHGFPRNRPPSGSGSGSVEIDHHLSSSPSFSSSSSSSRAADAAAAALSDFQASLSAAQHPLHSALAPVLGHTQQQQQQLQQQQTPSLSPKLPTVRTAMDLAAGTPVAPAIALLQQDMGNQTMSLSRVLRLEPHRVNFATDRTGKVLITPADRRDLHDAEVRTQLPLPILILYVCVYMYAH